ncbi:DUF6435 family protein [Marinobacterium sp. MBR-109]|jgi:hypothetical protein|uniref:DUF6435 family protein n=1 Tax=Marinobacterium sp. MBR-109 TaxID=3156462 RepID=UPI0033971D64
MPTGISVRPLQRHGLVPLGFVEPKSITFRTVEKPQTEPTMFAFLKSDPTKKLKKRHSLLLEQAMQAQRKGDIRTYSQLTAEAEKVYGEIQDLSISKS